MILPARTQALRAMSRATRQLTAAALTNGRFLDRKPFLKMRLRDKIAITFYSDIHTP
jgi:hypothetical protein